jgi:hypothetical protein
MADRGNVSLVEEELGSVPPALAALSVLRGEGQDVVGSITDGAQDGAILGRQRLGELLGEVRGRQGHTRIFGWHKARSRVLAPAGRPDAVTTKRRLPSRMPCAENLNDVIAEQLASKGGAHRVEHIVHTPITLNGGAVRVDVPPL